MSIIWDSNYPKKGIQPGDKDLTAIRDYPIPRTWEEVRSFLGLCTYFMCFIPNYSDISLPLSKLVEFKRYISNSYTESAFQVLRQCLMSSPDLPCIEKVTKTERNYSTIPPHEKFYIVEDIFTLMDGLTGFVIAWPLRAATVYTTITILDRLFSILGPPRELHSDNGSVFTEKDCIVL